MFIKCVLSDFGNLDILLEIDHINSEPHVKFLLSGLGLYLNHLIP